MSHIGGFISAPIKLAAIISNRRNEMDNPSGPAASASAAWPLALAQPAAKSSATSSKTMTQHQQYKSPTSSCSCQKRKRSNNNNNIRPPFIHYLCSSSLAPSLLLILLCNLPSFGAIQVSGAESHTARHQTHYLNIVPSTHFQYNEGRQVAAAARPSEPQQNHHQQQEQKREAEAAASAHSNTHIYKRSSALLASPSPSGGSGFNYLPLISSMPVHAHHAGVHQHASSHFNPLRRRMMSAESARWTPANDGEQQQLSAEPMATSGSDPAAATEEGVAPRTRLAPQQTAASAPRQQQQQQPRRPEHEEAELLRQKQHIQYHDQWPSVAGKCHKRTLNFCASVLPFNTTTFPNIIGDTNRFEVKRSLPFFGFLAKSSCNKRLDELLCLLLEPPCSVQSGAAIPPCKKFCRLALEGCNEYIPATLAMSSVFDCRQYPDSNDPSVCINLAQGSKCAQDEFKCPDKTCIPRNWLCDGVRDCLFAADEANCTAPTGVGLQTSVCSTEEFKCDGKCVPKAWKCDGERDCLDGYDEEHCDQRPRCGPDRFKCADGNGCLPKRWVCDGKAECRDGSDEMNCEEQECSENDFKCDNGICIPKLWRCDHQFDCKDGSDERSCVYPQSTTTSTTTTTTTTTTQAPTTTTVGQQLSINQDEDSTAANFYLNSSYSNSGAELAAAAASPMAATTSKQVVVGGGSPQANTDEPTGAQSPPSAGSSQAGQPSLVLEMNPANYYSGDSSQQQQQQLTAIMASSREQLESNVNDDVSRIIKQESSSGPPISGDGGIHLDQQQQQHHHHHQAGRSTSAQQSAADQTAPSSQRPATRELSKFDYDIIQSASSPSNLIQLADLMVSSEMANRQIKSHQQQPKQLASIDFAQANQQQPPDSVRQVTPSSASNSPAPLGSHQQQQQQQQQQQMSFGQQRQTSQTQQQQQAAGSGRTFAAPHKASGEPQHPAGIERVPIYRSLFKTLKHGQGRLAAASAAQHRTHHQAGGARRRRGDRHQMAPAAPAPQVAAETADQLPPSRFPHWAAASSLAPPAAFAPDLHQESAASSPPSGPVNQPAAQHHQQVANNTRTHGVASYLQLLNSRYNLRLPRVSPMPPSTRA